MRILFVGNTSLQNDAITKILRSQDGWEVSQMVPAKVVFEKLPFSEHQFFLSLIDLSSVSQNAESFIQVLQGADFATYLAVIYDDHPEFLLQNLLAAGADTCVSVNDSTEQFFGTISQFQKS